MEVRFSLQIAWKISLKTNSSPGKPGVDKYVHFSGSISGLRNSLKIATRIFHFSQYSGKNLDMLFEMAKSVEIVIILGKTAILL